MSNKQSRVLLLHTKKNYGGSFFIPSWSNYMASIVPTIWGQCADYTQYVPTMPFEQAGSHFARIEWKTYRLHVNVKKIWRNDCSPLISFAILLIFPRFLHKSQNRLFKTHKIGFKNTSSFWLIYINVLNSCISSILSFPFVLLFRCTEIFILFCSGEIFTL